MIVRQINQKSKIQFYNHRWKKYSILTSFLHIRCLLLLELMPIDPIDTILTDFKEFRNALAKFCPLCISGLKGWGGSEELSAKSHFHHDNPHLAIRSENVYLIGAIQVRDAKEKKRERVFWSDAKQALNSKIRYIRHEKSAYTIDYIGNFWSKLYFIEISEFYVVKWGKKSSDDDDCHAGLEEFQRRQRPFSKIHHTLSDLLSHLFTAGLPTCHYATLFDSKKELWKVYVGWFSMKRKFHRIRFAHLVK